MEWFFFREGKSQLFRGTSRADSGTLSRIKFLAAIVTVSVGLVGCAATLPPSSKQVLVAGQSSSDSFKKAIRGLLASNYEIKSQDQSSGLIQAFRPMTGAFTRPGYGHNVTITLESGSFTVKAFPMAGVIGGETPEAIRDEVIAIISR